MSRRRRLIAASSLALLVAACGRVAPATPPALPQPIAITLAPPVWSNAEAAYAVDANGALRAGLARGGPSRVIAADGAFAARPPACVEDPTCLVEVGRATGARKLVQVRLASLGTTTLVRVVVLDLMRGTQEQTRQEVVRDAEARSVSSAISRAAEAIARPWAPTRPQPEDRAAWYENGWLWAGVGAVAVTGAAMAIGVAAGADEASPPAKTEEERPDVTLTPP